jgi:hypothetical protein
MQSEWFILSPIWSLRLFTGDDELHERKKSGGVRAAQTPSNVATPDESGKNMRPWNWRKVALRVWVAATGYQPEGDVVPVVMTNQEP